MLDTLHRLTPVLEVLALLATTVGFVMGVVQLYIGRKEAQSARDLEITLNLSDSFRTRWEAGWRRALQRLEDGTSTPESGDHEELLNMLNWVDWLGNLIDGAYLRDEGVVLDAVGPQMRRMLEVGRREIEQDIRRHGRAYWKGLLIIAQRLGVTFA